MIKIEKTDVYGWESAIRGMRNPKNSWNKSDSKFDIVLGDMLDSGQQYFYDVKLGENDLKLAKTLANAGPEHGKFLRMINVTCDITAPLYWWKEYDTYKVGTVADSCSTMHKIQAKKFELSDFSFEHLRAFTFNSSDFTRIDSKSVLQATIDVLNAFRNAYNETQDKAYWWQMIQLLPSSYNQKRTVQVNYAVLRSMYHQRKNHKLDEWHTFCDWVESLPYAKELILDEN